MHTGCEHETSLTVTRLTVACTQALPQWPNTVSVGTKPMQALGGEKPRGSRVGRAVAAVRQRTLGSPPQLGDHVQALWTGYKSVTRPDQQLLDRLPLLPLLLYAVVMNLTIFSITPAFLLSAPGRVQCFQSGSCSQTACKGTCTCVAIV